jgi:hypothetical protein
MAMGKKVNALKKLVAAENQLTAWARRDDRSVVADAKTQSAEGTSFPGPHT